MHMSNQTTSLYSGTRISASSGTRISASTSLADSPFVHIQSRDRSHNTFLHFYDDSARRMYAELGKIVAALDEASKKGARDDLGLSRHSH